MGRGRPNRPRAGSCGPTLDIHEEEIPREGARITRGFQYARWLNGTPLLWLGRRKLPGRGEGASGLRFDTATRTGGGEPARAPSERP